MTAEFALNPGLDTRRLARDFAAAGRVTIVDFLAPASAKTLADHIRQRDDWLQVFNSGDRLIEMDRETRASLTADQVQRLDEAVQMEARNSFQYRYETVRVPDDEVARAERGDLLSRFASWLSTGEAREFIRAVTGEGEIRFADCQATAYSPGDFLTEHTDHADGKNRHAAYVLGLSPEWKIAWGGLLLYHRPDGADAVVPRFNCLNLFRVPQPHSVSMVTQAAAFRRYSITGWLRH